MGKHKKTVRKLYKRNRKFVKKKNESQPRDMDILKDITNKSSIDPINKVDAWLKENEKYKESTIGDSSSVREEKYKQKHIYMDKLYQNFETFLSYKTACRKLSDMKVKYGYSG